MEHTENASEVVVYTDGSCSQGQDSPLRGTGGWAALICMGGKEIRIAGHNPATTNTCMELTAAVRALTELLKFGRSIRIRLCSDCENLITGLNCYLTQWALQGWRNLRGQPLRNADLWKQLLGLKRRLNIEAVWVKAHASDLKNQAADELAGRARHGLRLCGNSAF